MTDDKSIHGGSLLARASLSLFLSLSLSLSLIATSPTNPINLMHKKEEK